MNPPAIHPDKLADAASVMFRAYQSDPHLAGQPLNIALRSVGGPAQPEGFYGFARWELEEAAAFLHRCGLCPKE